MAPAHHKLVSGSGYESPTEVNQPPFFVTPPFIDGLPTTTRPIARPILMQRPSYIAATPDGSRTPSRTPNGQGWSPQNQGSTFSLNDIIANSEKLNPRRNVSIKDRIACYQWTFFTMTMSTGGIANVLHALKWDAPWIRGIGVFFFLLNIVLFLINCICISIRFHLRPGSFTNSFTDQVESLFIPSFFVSIAIILINICEYGIPNTDVWLLRTMEIMFWIYVALSVFASAGLYLVLWSTLVFPVHMMTPTWVFPAYPLLLTAPFASNMIASAEIAGHPLSLNATAIALGATTAQGTGCLIAFMISSAFIYRLMTQKLPRDMQRPGIFMSIGPFGFTAAGIAQLGTQAKNIIPPDFIETENSAAIIKIISILVSLWLWGLALWFFLISIGSLWKYVRQGSSIPFQMTWWSFVFPNTALVTATDVLGGIFESHGLHVFGAVMTLALIVVWIGIFGTMLMCLKDKKLLWPKANT